MEKLFLIGCITGPKFPAKLDVFILFQELSTWHKIEPNCSIHTVFVPH